MSSKNQKKNKKAQKDEENVEEEKNTNQHEGYTNPKPLWNENSKSNKFSDSINLNIIQCSINGENKRERTCLLSNEENLSICSDIQLCSIIDTLIYDKYENNFEEHIKPIWDGESEKISDLLYLNFLFQLFGFENLQKINNLQNFFDLTLPFLSKKDNDSCKKYVTDHLNDNKSFYSWISFGFRKEEYTKFNGIDSLENNEMTKENFNLLNKVGVALNIKFTNIYIQTETNEIKAFDLGDINSNNRIFIGLYNNENKIHFCIPILSSNEKGHSNLIFSYTKDDQITPFMFLPNYGHIYLKDPPESINIPYFQIFSSRFQLNIKIKGKVKNLIYEQKNSFLNNDFPIYFNQYEKEIEHTELTSLSQIKLFIQSNLKNKNKIKISINEKNDDKCSLIFKNIFKLPDEVISKKNEEGSPINFDFNSIKVDKLNVKNNQYLFHLMNPDNIIPYIPCLKISSSLELINAKVNSLSRLFFVAKNEKDVVYFGDGDFGSSNLDDMFICPTKIETEGIISSFIISSEIIFTQNDVFSLSPGIIVLYKRDHRNYITHYSRTKHIWKNEREFEVSEVGNSASVFFYSSKYIILYKGDDNKFICKSYSYNKSNTVNEEKQITFENDDLVNACFTNGKIYFLTDKNKCLVLENADDGKYNLKNIENPEENGRVQDILVNVDQDKKFDLNTKSTSKRNNNDNPYPLAVEINNKVHVLKVDNKKPVIISSMLYHPANKNSILKYSILSMFYRFRRHFNHELVIRDESKPCIIHTSIDCSYNGDFSTTFMSSSSPGIYANILDERDSKKYKYSDYWSDCPNIVWIYFHNGKLQTGLTERRTLCQLAAAFACSFAISVYTSTGKVICYESPNQNAVLWTDERCRRMEKNLVATYGTLLEMKNDYEFEFALSVLETTKDLISDFRNFLRSVSSQ